MAIVALTQIDQARGDGPGPGDPWTPGENKEGTSISVESNDDGVTIFIGISDTADGSSGDPSCDGGGTSGDYSTWTCTADVMNIGQALLAWFLEESAKHPGEAPWIVRCNDELIGIVWVPTDADPADVEIVVLTRPILVRRPNCGPSTRPDLTIREPRHGLVALPPGSGSTATGFADHCVGTLGGVTVDVEIAPQRTVELR